MSTLRALFRSSRSHSGASPRRGFRRALRVRAARVSAALLISVMVAAILPASVFAGIPQRFTWGSFPTYKYWGDADFVFAAVPTDDTETVVFSSGGTCEVTATGDLTARIHITSAGLCTINAYAPGGGGYDPALDVKSFPIYTASQYIDFPSLTVEIGFTAHLAATSKDAVTHSATGLPVSFETAAGASCDAYQDYYGDWRVQGVSGGDCTVKATQAGNIDYNSAETLQVIHVAKHSQTITFPPISNKLPGSDFSLSVSASSGLPVSLTSSGGCELDGFVVHVTAESGSCTITASQGGNAYYSAAPNVPQSFAIAKADQTITFLPIQNKMPGEQFDLSGRVWASSGRQVTLTSAGCGVYQFEVYALGVGSCTITAHQDGDAQYNQATPVSQSFYIGSVGDRAGAMADSQAQSPALNRFGADGQGYDRSSHGWDWCADFAHWVWRTSGVNIPRDFETPPAITTAPADPRGWAHDNVNWFVDYGNIYGTTSSTPAVGDAIVFSNSLGGGVAHVAIVTWVSSDGKSIDFVGGNQGGGDGFVTKVGSVPSAIGSNATGQYILTYVAPMEVGTAIAADAAYSMQTGQVATGSFTVATNAGSSSNLDVIVGPFFSSVDLQLHRPNGTLVSPSDPGVTFTESANLIEVSIAGAQPGVWTYEIKAVALEAGGEDIHIQAATTPVITTTVIQEPAESPYLQPATFTAFVMPAIDGGATPTGNVQFNLDGNPAGTPVALDAAGQATWTTSDLSVGSHTVSVNYLGSDPLVAPSSATITHVVTKAAQAITFGALGDKTYGDADFGVSATASSGLAVTFAATGGCTLSGTTVHITAAGSCTITASQAGDGNYNAAPDVPQSFAIAKADQTITFGALAGKTYGDADFGVGATASSSLAVTFAATGGCTVSGTTVHIVGAGSCTITASQAGDGNYNPAPDVPQSFSIAKKALTITAKDATKSYGKALSFAGTEFSVAGLVRGDGVTSVTLASAGQPAGAQPGTYAIVASAALGTRLSNYDITYRDGTLTVNLVAIVGLDGVTISGGSTIDSYNGATGPYSSKTKQSAAFVVSNGSISMDGSAAVRGDVRSTQGKISLTGGALVTGSAYAGTTIALRSLVHGSAYPNSPLSALTAPAVAACSPYSSSVGLSGSYTYNTRTGNLSVSGNNTLTIANGTYCFGSITLAGSARLVVNGPVILRLTGQFTADGATIANLTNNAANLQISTSYAGNNGVVIAGSGNACLSMYAPAAQVVLSGAAQISGPVLGKSISLSGSAAIHQDTSLGGVWAGYYRN